MTIENKAPYDAIFFDMDGTLLHMSVDTFLKRYYQELTMKLTCGEKDKKSFITALNAGLDAMGGHSWQETNAAAFWRTFGSTIQKEGLDFDEGSRNRAMAFLQDFYTHEFDRCGENTVPDPHANEVVHILHDKGYPLYLTTMPLFPLEGVLARLRWAGVDPTVFSRITTYENSTAVKPQLAFYYENLSIAGASGTPERVLMVGNNTDDDLACLDAGMDAYLVTDELIDENGFDISTVKHGSLEEFTEWARRLPVCTATTALEGDPDRDPITAGIYTEQGRAASPVPLWNDVSTE